MKSPSEIVVNDGDLVRDRSAWGWPPSALLQSLVVLGHDCIGLINSISVIHLITIFVVSSLARGFKYYIFK